jgi:hypothetical protein
LKLKISLTYLIFVLLLLSYEVQAQRNVKDSSITTPLIGVHYGSIFTGGDLANRYGYLNHVGVTAGYKLKSNTILGIDANFIFGNKIKAADSTFEFYGLFNHLVDSQGNITDINGDIAKVMVYARGFNVNGKIGKIIPILSPNKNSGLMLEAGAGFILHHLRIETQDQVIPQLELDYKKGYDRMTTGLNLHQFIGYSFLANSGFYNFYGGVYIQEGFTYNRRVINFDKPNLPVSTSRRFDLQYGVRIGWYIPFYKRQPKDYYFD